MTRCLVVGNTADVGGGIYAGSGSQLTLVANETRDLVPPPFPYNGVSATLSKSIIWGNVGIIGPAGECDCTYSNLEVPSPGVGNISIDPLFVGPVPNYLALQAGSPCIDAGDPALTDPDGSRIDMGAIPFELPLLPQPSTFCTPNALCPSTVGWTGAASLTGQNTLTVFASQVPADQFGLLVLSRSSYATNPIADSGAGILCLAGPYVRMPVQRSNTGGPCDGSFRQEVLLTALHRLGLSVGDSLHAQYWFRSPGPVPFGVSEAMAIPVVR